VDDGDFAVSLADQVFAGEFAGGIAVGEHGVTPGGLVFAEPDHRDVVDFLEDIDGAVFPGDADDAVDQQSARLPMRSSVIMVMPASTRERA
jgi:hypothetical protein